ncbi:bifunctional diguanylate cyclase/phosphodiesterase [Halomonas sp. HG01]|uniref:bifunctional diguanylate cyclase/phosphodiesterase n=1 Tax=Halomonas sp. HG01 TaxID=1609967 RepID=UPI0006145914|nr:EAL domain-containing protein [Halomonas sp. HG01]
MKRELPWLEAQQDIHERIARQQPLHDTLSAIARWVELVLPGATAAFMRHEPSSDTLGLEVGEGLSDAYARRCWSVPLNAEAASFAAAAREGRFIVSDDIALDPRWVRLRAAALDEGVRACWSMPVVSPDDTLLGVLDAYFPTPREPTQVAERRLRQAAALISLALIRDRDGREHKALSRWHHALFDNHPHGAYAFDLEGRFQRVNPAVERITGHSPEAMLGMHFCRFVEPAWRASAQANFDRARAGETLTYEIRIVHASGRSCRLEVSKFPVIIDGEIVSVYGVCRDVTQERRQTDELRLLKRGIDASPAGMLMIEARFDTPIVFSNPAFEAMTGYAQNEVMGRSWELLQGPETETEAVEAMHMAIRQRRGIEVTLRHYRKDGSTFWNHLIISPVFDAGGDCTHFIGSLRDVTLEKEQEALIAYQATHDLTTGLPNHGDFVDRLGEALSQPAFLAVMILNMDGFKSINEGLGRPLGNQVLMRVAQRLRRLVGEGQVVARLMGDEFGVMLTGLDGGDSVAELAERTLETLALPIEADGQRLHVSASIGIADNEGGASQPHELLQHADSALERAKRQGRNTWQWYRGREVAGSRDSVLLRHDLHAALQDEQFELHYQPLVEAPSGRICGVEALVRWRHPERGMVSPGDFIPLAEQTGQIIPLGRWVLRRACRELAGFNAGRERPLSLAVNISSLQFHRDGFFDEVCRVLDETGLPPGQLELEVTESVFLDGASQVVDVMNRLKAIGVRVAIDDFGTGFSSLSYLCDLPTHKVKLDRSFIARTPTERRSAAIVQGVITMAHHMDMVVVAEGIETAVQWQDMLRRRCDLLQGFYFARPMPLTALGNLPDHLAVDSPIPLT